jgi:hypothetical protein
MNQAPRHEDILGSGVIAPLFLTLELNGGEWWALWRGRFTPGKITHPTRWIGIRVSPRVSLDLVEKRKISCANRESNPAVQLVAQSYTDSIVMNLKLFVVKYGVGCLFLATVNR